MSSVKRFLCWQRAFILPVAGYRMITKHHSQDVHLATDALFVEVLMTGFAHVLLVAHLPYKKAL